MEQRQGRHWTTFTREELEATLSTRMNPIALNKVVSAYDISESVHGKQMRNDGSPYFFHCARVCQILACELMIDDADVLSASLLHDVLEERSDKVTKEVIAYNFGDYVTYMVETLTKDLERHRQNPEEIDREAVQRLRDATPDCLTIRLAARLDNFRCLEYNVKRNPFHYVNVTTERYIPLAEGSTHPHLRYLVNELKKERNKFLG